MSELRNKLEFMCEYYNSKVKPFIKKDQIIYFRNMENLCMFVKNLGSDRKAMKLHYGLLAVADANIIHKKLQNREIPANSQLTAFEHSLKNYRTAVESGSEI